MVLDFMRAVTGVMRELTGAMHPVMREVTGFIREVGGAMHPVMHVVFYVVHLVPHKVCSGAASARGVGFRMRGSEEGVKGGVVSPYLLKGPGG